MWPRQERSVGPTSESGQGRFPSEPASQNLHCVNHRAILHPGHWEAGAVSASLGGQFVFSLGILVKPSNKTNYGYQAKPSHVHFHTHLGHILYKMYLTDEGGYLTGGGVGKKEFWPQPRVIPAQTQKKKNIKIKHQTHPQGFTCLHLAVIKTCCRARTVLNFPQSWKALEEYVYCPWGMCVHSLLIEHKKKGVLQGRAAGKGKETPVQPGNILPRRAHCRSLRWNINVQFVYLWAHIFPALSC